MTIKEQLLSITVISNEGSLFVEWRGGSRMKAREECAKEIVRRAKRELVLWRRQAGLR